MRLSVLLIGALLCGLATAGFARETTAPVMTAVDLAGRAERLTDDLSLTLGEYAEPALAEYRSFVKVVGYLAGAGFKLQAGAGNIPTALVASWGTGQPVVGIRAGMDAEQSTGHSRGRNLETAAAVAAAIALKETLRELGLSGTVKLFLYPAGGTLDAGRYLAEAGLFRELDALITADAGAANRGDTLAGEALRAAGCADFTMAEEGVMAATRSAGYAASLVPTSGFTFAVWAPGTPEGSAAAAAQAVSGHGARSAAFAAKALSALGIGLLTEPVKLAAVKSRFQTWQAGSPPGERPPAIPPEAFPEAPGVTVRADGVVRFVAQPTAARACVTVPEPLEEVVLGAYDCGV